MLRSRPFWGIVFVVSVLGWAVYAEAAMILAPTDPIYGVSAAPGDALSGFIPNTAQNRYPTGEPPAKAIDGIVLVGTTNGNKYLNFGETNVGFIVVPAFGPSKLTSFRMASGNDAVERDPMTITIEGTNGPFLDYLGVFNAPWTLIYNGPSGLATDPGRNAWGPDLSITAPAQLFSYYRVLITTVRDAAAANSMQFTEIELNGVPEPASMLLVGSALPLLLIRRRRA